MKKELPNYINIYEGFCKRILLNTSKKTFLVETSYTHDLLTNEEVWTTLDKRKDDENKQITSAISDLLIDILFSEEPKKHPTYRIISKYKKRIEEEIEKNINKY